MHVCGLSVSHGVSMLDLIVKNRMKILTAVALLGGFVLYSLNLRQKEHTNVFEQTVITVASPVLEAVARVDGFFSYIWDNYIYLTNVEQENRGLRESVKLLNKSLVEKSETALENERLRKLLGLRDSLHLPTLAASVVSEDSSPWFRTVTIDRGRKDGVKEGMPVLSSAGVVGRVVKMGEKSSRILLLTDHASGISAVIERSRARGVVKGKGGKDCALDFSERGEDVRIGDVVVTSGLGGGYPKGLPIGEVAMVKKGQYGIFQVVDVRPYVNISRLEEVLVVLHRNDEE